MNLLCSSTKKKYCKLNDQKLLLLSNSKQKYSLIQFNNGLTPLHARHPQQKLWGNTSPTKALFALCRLCIREETCLGATRHNICRKVQKCCFEFCLQASVPKSSCCPRCVLGRSIPTGEHRRLVVMKCRNVGYCVWCEPTRALSTVHRGALATQW